MFALTKAGISALTVIDTTNSCIGIINYDVI